MAEIYQIPENGNNNSLPYSIPVGFGGFGGNGMFGNGNGFNSIADLFGLAIIASMFGWGNGGFGGGFGFGGGNGAAGFLSNQINNDNGRDLIMQAVTNQGEASRTAIQTLSTMLGQDFNLVNSAVGNVQNALQSLALQQAVSVPQIINAIQSGDSALTSAFQKCCCENQLAICQQTNALQTGMNAGFNGVERGMSGIQTQMALNAGKDELATCQQTYSLTDGANRNTQAILAKLDSMQTQALQDKLDAAREKNTQLAGEISQLNQNQYIAGVVGQTMAPVNAQLAALNKEVDDIKCKLPNTVNVQYPNLVAVNATPYVSGGIYPNGMFGGGYGYGNFGF